MVTIINSYTKMLLHGQQTELMPVMLNLGRVNFIVPMFCGVLLCDKGNGNTYIAEKLNSVTKRYVSYVGNPKLMNNVMAEIYIDFPSIQEQETISKLLTRIDERIKTANFLYERIISLKQGLLQQLFI